VESLEAQGIPAPAAKKKILEVQDELTSNDPIDPVQTEGRRDFGCHHKVHLIKMVAGRVYTIEMHSLTQSARPFQLRPPNWDKWDNFLRLENGKKKHLVYNDDIVEAKILDARIKDFKCPRTGFYRIIATSFEPAEMGKYRLIVWEEGIGEEVTRLDLTYGEDRADGVLPKASKDTIDQARPFSVFKEYQVELEAGKTYQIDLTSKDFDAYLRLLDAAGKELARDDNGGSGLDARITFQCSRKGGYRILATSALGGKGAYLLTVKKN
jgi:hypothetical protein